MPGTLSNLHRFGNKKTAAEAFESPPKAFNRRIRAQDCTVFAHLSIQPKTLAGGRILFAAWRKTKPKSELNPPLVDSKAFLRPVEVWGIYDDSASLDIAYEIE